MQNITYNIMRHLNPIEKYRKGFNELLVNKFKDNTLKTVNQNCRLRLVNISFSIKNNLEYAKYTK